MKKIFITFFCILCLIAKVNAETFTQALKKAYEDNSELNAERESINISEQELKVSRSAYLPTITLSGTQSEESTEKLTKQSGGDARLDDVDPTEQSITITQTLIDFGRRAELEKSKIGLDLSKAKLLKKEQDILYKSIEAYTGLIAANEKFKINQSNVNLLDRQVETDRIRLERGQITLSDVAQSESSLAEAQAKLIQAESNLLIGLLNYKNVIGEISDPELLSKSSIIEIDLPTTLEAAIELSKKNNPDLKISEFEYQQSKKDTSNAKSDLAPTATLSFDKSKTEDLSATYDEREKDVLQATVSWPFQFGGKNKSNVNKNLQVKGMKKLLLENAFRNNTQGVTAAWSTLESSKSLLRAVQSQVKAAEIANEGISFEYESGLNRSTFDVLQSRSNLINAKINLAEAERNYLLAQYRLLKSAGLLNSDYLKLR